MKQIYSCRKPIFAVLLMLGGVFFSPVAKAQNVTGYGYTSFTSVNAGTWTYGSVSNPFTVTFSGGSWNEAQKLATYTPVFIPTALSNYVQPANMLELGAVVSGTLPIALYTFTSPLPAGTVLFIQDVDALESYRIEFLDASGAVLNPSTIGTYNLSNPFYSTATLSSTALTVTATDNVNYGESLSDFVISSSLVKQVRITQIAGRSSSPGTAEFYFATAPVNYVNIQSCTPPAAGCSNIDFTNSYLNSSNPNTIEYDNIVSTFHSTVARQSDGTVMVWGERMANDGASNVLTPQLLSSTNYPALTGSVLKFAGGSYNGGTAIGTSLGQQYVVLTTTGLFAWGIEDRLISTAITSSTTFQKLTINSKADGLPTGVSPADVKMLFGSYSMLAIVTCSGDVYTLVNAISGTPATANGYGDGTAYSAANNIVWHKVKQNISTDLTNVVAVRGGGIYAFTALKSDGTLWTWGYKTYLGNATAIATTRNYATQMTVPVGITPKMIGMKGSFSDDNLSYYLLTTTGLVYSMGSNGVRQLGDLTTTNRTFWVKVQSAVGTDLSNIVWISPSEHDAEYMAPVNAIQSDGSLWSWGENESSQIGQPSGTFNINPTKNTGGLGTSKILALETGGHTTIVIKQCDQQYGYVGHRINGSMGDGTSTSAAEPNFNFTNTATLNLCGASAAPTLTASSSNICTESPVTLTASPAGGTYTVTSGNATISGNTVTVTGAGQVDITYTAPSCDLTSTISLSQVCPVSITGNVWNDVNGNAINSSENPITSGVWVNLVDPISNDVIQSVQVDASGNYSFTALPQNTSYNIILTAANQAGNLNLTGATIPSGYISTGTNLSAVANTSNTTGMITVNTGTGGLTQQNFGIEQIPDSTPKTNAVPYPSGGVIPVGAVTTAVSGTDPEDGTLGNGTTVVITTLPTNAAMYYFNGTVSVAVTAGQVIPNFNPALLSFTSITTGSVNVIFNYAFLDAAGQQGTSATYTVSWLTALPIVIESFTGKANACNTVLLNWKVSDAVNFSHFELEKQTGTNLFKTAARVVYEPGNNSYFYTDVITENSNCSYRIKLVDTDGKYSYSAVISMSIRCIESSIRLNPTVTSAHAKLTGLSNGQYVNILSATGQVVESKMITGRNDYLLDLTGLSNGMYFVVIRDEKNNVLFSTKLLKQ